MTYRPVVDVFPIVPPLDPLSAVVFVAFFAGAAFVTSRRAAYGACVLVLITPFALYHTLFAADVTLPKAVLLGVLAGLTTYPGTARLLLRRPMPLLLGAIAFYLLATALSGLGALHLDLALRETFKVVEYGLFFVAAYLCYRIDPDGPLVIGALAAVTIVVSLTALAQEFLGAPSGLYVGRAIVPRVAGALEGPNQLAGYFEVAIAAAGAWAASRRTTLIAVALFLATAADVLTFSRSGLLGLGVVALVVLAAGGRSAARSLRPALAGFVAGLAGIAGWGVYAQSANVFRVSFESAYAGGVGNRAELWLAAWKMWSAHPLLGIGAGNYELELPLYGVMGVRTHANSWYLQSLAEGGLLLFAATIALIASSIATFARGIRAASPWAVAALAATIALALHQIGDYLVFYPKVGEAWMVLLGLAAASV
ncbi:MAG: O-antigen ligase family protein [Candidatus Eremiobacteraeota bacterium]|nr:O-antigen ligase family protein [Candidatus Eremiobacteraeota bacterium]